MSIAEDILNKAKENGYLEPDEVSVIYQRIVAIGKNLNQVDPSNFADQLCMCMIMESGLDPSIVNSYGCTGLIQFCPGTGLAELGKSSSEVASMSFLVQLNEVELFLSRIKGYAPFPDPNNLTAEELYLAILYPTSVGGGQDDPVNAGSHQADVLYNSQGQITKRSVLDALKKVYESYMGSPAPDLGSRNKRTAPGTGASSGPSLVSQDGIFLISGRTSKRKYFTNLVEAKAARPELLTDVIYSGGSNSLTSGGVASTASSKPVDLGNVSLPENFDKTDFTNPLPGGIVTSGFGWRWGRMHNGVDIAGNGLDVLSSAAGVVTTICSEDSNSWQIFDINTKTIQDMGACNNGYGNSIVISHSDSIVSTYNHLAPGGIKVQLGQEVKRGELIGIEGTTGNSTGIHLHFEIKIGGEFIDPLELIKVD